MCVIKNFGFSIKSHEQDKERTRVMSHGFQFITRKEPQNHRMYVIKSFCFSVKKTHEQEKKVVFSKEKLKNKAKIQRELFDD